MERIILKINPKLKINKFNNSKIKFNNKISSVMDQISRVALK